MSKAEVASCDIAEVNLSYAVGLPGSESLDIPSCLGTINRWADIVHAGTERVLPRFRNAPDQFENCQAYFRVLAMVTILQRDLGVRYNPERIHEPDYRDSRDLFIHGLITGNGGTCVSMPVLYVAVGRRLGYPLWLVQARAHLFSRWDEPNKKLNIEATGQGLTCYPDKHYLTWPLPMRAWEAHACLTSFTPDQERACFLATQGHCLEDNGCITQAANSYEMATRLSPSDLNYHGFLRMALDQERAEVMRRRAAISIHQTLVSW